jgi:hypothetical protein
MAAVLLAAGASVVSCNREAKREPRMTPASAYTPIENKDRNPTDRNDANRLSLVDEGAVSDRGVGIRAAVGAIASARCDHEAKCNNIGADKKYKSADECNRSMVDTHRDALDDCHEGVGRAQLSECLSSIRDEDCESPFQSLDRVITCRSAKLCLD